MVTAAHVGLMLLTSWAASDIAWEEIAQKDGVTVYSRDRGQSDIHEVRATAEFDQPPWVIKNVISDQGHYYEFMPHTKTSLILKESRNSKLIYQYLSAPIISDRDYVLKIRELSRRQPDGTIIYKHTWKSVTGIGPKKADNVVRVKTEGSWVLEPLAGGHRTKATYLIWANPGGNIPAFFINRVQQRTVPELFTAVAVRAKMPQYHQSKPILPDLKSESNPTRIEAPTSGKAKPDAP